MSVSMSLPRSLTVSFLSVAVALGSALAQPAQQEYVPQVGQAGKDVVWVPTAQTLVDKMLEMAKVTPNDYVIDLGSGDGRTVISAARLGARAHGIEYNPDMVELSKRNAVKEGVADKATFVQGDIFESDFSTANVLTLFLLPSLNMQLRPTILNMKAGTRVVSNTFDMGDWTPDETADLGGSDCTSHCRALFWIVPANVEGTWKLPDGQLELKQSFQNVTGTLKSGNVVTPVAGKLRGAEIVFSGGGTDYRGKVEGGSIDLTATSAGKETSLTATRG